MNCIEEHKGDGYKLDIGKNQTTENQQASPVCLPICSMSNIDQLPDCILVNLFPYFSVEESCNVLMQVSKRWYKLVTSHQCMWKQWCEECSWYGNLTFSARGRNGHVRAKCCKIDFKEKWLLLKESERRWKQGHPLSACVLKHAHDFLIVNMGHCDDDRYLYSADKLGNIKTWNLETTVCENTITSGLTIKFAQFTDNGYAIVACAQGMQIWDLKNQATEGAVLSAIQYDRIVLSNTRLLAVVDNVVELWDVTTATKTHEFLDTHVKTSVLCASLCGDIFVTGCHERICIWDIRTKHCERVIESGAFDLELNSTQIVSCHYGDPRNSALKYDNNFLCVRDLRSDRKQEKAVDGGYILYTLEGNKLVAGNDTRRNVDVWDSSSGCNFEQQTPGSLKLDGTAVCITTKVAKLFVATCNGNIYMYDF